MSHNFFASVRVVFRGSRFAVRGSGLEIRDSSSDHDIRDPDARIGASMTARLAEPFAALLPEHSNLGATRLAVDDPQDLRIRDERGAGHHLPAILFQEQYLVKGDFFAHFGIEAVERDHGARIDLQLASAGLYDCEHDFTSPRALPSGPLSFCTKELG